MTNQQSRLPVRQRLLPSLYTLSVDCEDGTYFCVCFNAPIETSCFLFSPSFLACCCHGFFRNLNRERVASLLLSACASARFLPVIPIKGGTAQDQKVCWAWSLREGADTLNCSSGSCHSTSVVLISRGSRWFTGEVLT